MRELRDSNYETPTSYNWTPLAKRYHPLQAGSIDGTDTVPHDNAVWRAMYAKYRPNKQVTGDPECTMFVGRLSRETTEDTLEMCFSKFGDVQSCRVIRDFVTGFSRGYAFIEYKDRWQAKAAYREMHKQVIDGHEVLVEHEAGRNLEGWIPRRFGGGFGGKKESGQLRFGGRDRPFRRPLPVQTLGSTNKPQEAADRENRREGRVMFRDRNHDVENRVRDDRDRDGRTIRDERDRENRSRDDRYSDSRSRNERDRDSRSRDERDRDSRSRDERDRDGRSRDIRGRDERDRDSRGRDERDRDRDVRERYRDRDREYKRDRGKSSSRRHDRDRNREDSRRRSRSRSRSREREKS